MRLQPGALGQRQRIAPVEPAMRGEVDVLDAGVDKAQPGNGETVGQPLVGTHGGFTIEHQAKPFVATEIVGVALVGQVRRRRPSRQGRGARRQVPATSGTWMRSSSPSPARSISCGGRSIRTIRAR